MNMGMEVFGFLALCVAMGWIVCNPTLRKYLVVGFFSIAGLGAILIGGLKIYDWAHRALPASIEAIADKPEKQPSNAGSPRRVGDEKFRRFDYLFSR
jgi:hypothetical protein